jgi:hypothetical protein
MPRKKEVPESVEEIVIVGGVNINEVLDSKKPKEELPNIDWNTAKNKMTFLDYLALREKYGLEG